MTAVKQREIASLCWSLDIHCPKCYEANDLASVDHDPDFEIADAIFANDWDRLNGREVTCKHCGCEFEIEKVEY